MSEAEQIQTHPYYHINSSECNSRSHFSETQQNANSKLVTLALKDLPKKQKMKMLTVVAVVGSFVFFSSEASWSALIYIVYFVSDCTRYLVRSMQ